MNKLKLFNKIFLAVVFVLLTGSFISVSKAHAEVMGPNYPSTAVVDTSSGTVGWYFISNIMANDSQMATPDMPPGTTSHIGKVTNFGFSIPAGATINGIVVEFLSYSSADVRVNSIRLVKAGSYTGSTKGLNDTPIQGTSTYGNSSDLWGTTWTAAEVNASNFGVGLQFKNIHGVYQEGINIDYARITVYYTPAPTPTPTLTPTPSTTVPVLASPPSQTGKTDVAITLGGNVTSNGGAALSARGVCYSLTSQDSTPGFTTAGGSTPETNVTCVNEGSTSTGIFTIPQVTGLTPNTPYSFRAFARNSVGNGYSNVGSFTTYGPPTVTTSAASGITNTQASLNSIVNPNGTSTNISYLWGTQAGVDCNLQPNTLAGPIGQTGTSNISPNATTFGGLGSNTTYYYCVMATNTYDTNYGSVLPFTTLTSNPNSYGYMDAASALGTGATDCQDDPNGAPCAPVNSSGTNGSNPTASAVTTTRIDLAWGVNTAGGAVPASTGYDVQICGLNDTTCASVDSTVSVANNVFSHSNSPVTCSTSPSYYYRIVAKSGNGNTNSNIFSGVTSTCCTNGYKDYDGDGYGPNAGYGCWEAGAGYTIVASGGDCYDYHGSTTAIRNQSALARPGQTNYYSVPRGTSSGVNDWVNQSYNSYDYDCNGSSFFEYNCVSSMVACSNSLPSGTGGWVTSIPACGATGDFQYCLFHTASSCGGSMYQSAACASCPTGWSSYGRITYGGIAAKCR